MTPSDFFTLATVKRRRPDAFDASSIGLTYGVSDSMWTATAAFGGAAGMTRFHAAGRSIEEAFEVLMHQLRQRGLVDDASPPSAISSGA